jgi:uncharacterized protein
MRNSFRQFSIGTVERLQDYIYRYEDPQTNLVFYVGRGKGNRVFAHLFEADANIPGPKTDRIRQIWNAGNDVNIVIHRHGLSEEQAILAEQVLIDAYPSALRDREFDGDGGLTNKVRGAGVEFGSENAFSLNQRYSAEAATVDFPCLVVFLTYGWIESKPNRDKSADQQQLYEKTRGNWAGINPTKYSTVRHAIAVANGIIRQVYEIDPNTWKSSTITPDGMSISPRMRRWNFEGKVADDKAHLIGKLSPIVRQKGSQRPVRWHLPVVSASSEKLLEQTHA